MPHVPLKVLRGQQDEEDIQDQYHQRFQAPGTTTEEEAERAVDNDSTTSHISDEDITTDVDEVSDEGMERYLGRHTGPMHSVNQVDGDFGEIQDYQVVAQMHHLPDTDVTSDDSVDLSNDDRAPLLPNEH